MLRGVEDRLVFGDTGDEMVALVSIAFSYTEEGEIIGLSGSAGEDNFVGAGIDQRGHLNAGLFNRLACLVAEGVVFTGGIAEPLGEVGQHRSEYPWLNRRGGVMIHVDGQAGHQTPSSLPDKCADREDDAGHRG